MSKFFLNRWITFFNDRVVAFASITLRLSSHLFTAYRIYKRNRILFAQDRFTTGLGYCDSNIIIVLCFSFVFRISSRFSSYIAYIFIFFMIKLDLVMCSNLKIITKRIINLIVVVHIYIYIDVVHVYYSKNNCIYCYFCILFYR